MDVDCRRLDVEQVSDGMSGECLLQTNARECSTNLGDMNLKARFHRWRWYLSPHGVDQLLGGNGASSVEGQSPRDRALLGTRERSRTPSAHELDAPEQPHPGHRQTLDL